VKEELLRIRNREGEEDGSPYNSNDYLYAPFDFGEAN